MTSAESTIVFPNRVARLACVRTTAHDDWRAAVQLCGELDVANAAELRAELDSHLDAGRRVIRVDVSSLEFIDSTAVGALVAANTRCRKLHGSLILTGVRPPLGRLLKIAGLDQILLVDTANCG